MNFLRLEYMTHGNVCQVKESVHRIRLDLLQGNLQDEDFKSHGLLLLLATCSEAGR